MFILFAVAALLLGLVLVMLFYRLIYKMDLPNGFILVTAMIFVSILVSLIYFAMMPVDIVEIISLSNLAFWARVAIGWVIPLAMFAHFAYHKDQKMHILMMFVGFVLLLIGEILAIEVIKNISN